MYSLNLDICFILDIGTYFPYLSLHTISTNYEYHRSHFYFSFEHLKYMPYFFFESKLKQRKRSACVCARSHACKHTHTLTKQTNTRAPSTIKHRVDSTSIIITKLVKQMSYYRNVLVNTYNFEFLEIDEIVPDFRLTLPDQIPNLVRWEPKPHNREGVP